MALAFAVSIASPALCASRMALVIGISSYDHFKPLANPTLDAKLIAATLASLAFDVRRLDNPSVGELRDAIEDFSQQTKGSEAAVVYYAGHGVELQGRNLLLPRDIPSLSVGQAPFQQQAVTTEELRRAVLGASRIRVVILDACRENPFQNQPGVGLGAENGAGLTTTIVLMSAARNQKAADGAIGTNSPFALALSDALKRPGMTIGRLPAYVLSDVQDRVRGSRYADQSPDSQGILTDPDWAFSLAPHAMLDADPAKAQLAAERQDNSLWDRIKNSNDPSDFSTYIQAVDAGETLGQYRKAALDRLALARQQPATLAKNRDVSADMHDQAARSAYNQGDYPLAVREWQAAAHAGDPTAMYNLGVMFFTGRGMQADPAAAVGWFGRGAQAGNSGAMVNYGLSLLEGIGVRRDQAVGIEWLRRAADLGSPSAMARLGEVYLNGVGVPRDDSIGFDWIRRAADLGDGPALASLASLYEDGIGTVPDQAMAFATYRRAAASGESAAMVRIGYFYEEGTIVPRDGTQAANWFQRAAVTGNAEALASLGVVFEQGDGVGQDYEMARHYYEAAALRGHPRGYLGLGTLYLRGLGVVQDDRHALALFTSGAEAGSPAAMGNAGLMYLLGRGADRDEKKAIDYFRRGAAAGDAASIAALNKLGSQ